MRSAEVTRSAPDEGSKGAPTRGARLIAIEEHFNLPEVIDGHPYERMVTPFDELCDVDDRRIADMDAAGIDVQVLSSSSNSVQFFEEDRSISLARKVNDHLAEAVARHPGRFAGFATLPMPAPTEAARELERCVGELGFKGAMIHGHTAGRFLDHEKFWPILEVAEGLEVPIYLHPTFPPPAVFDAYYGDLEPPLAAALSGAAWGWHVDTGMHALRLVVRGVFDRFPRLQMVIGHMGEAIPFSLARSASVLGRMTGHLERPVSDYFFENFHLTTSGYFTTPPFLCALMVFGADRLIFSVDYPYANNSVARTFFDGLPVSPEDREKIAHANAEALLGL